ncbi:amino acid transporter [Rhodococcus opacus M213]|uniref:Amino acid transporter n=2 Tax=Rhodococcus opacus TaxID=37919 RepID=K8X8H0_RHOOP|nr:amino acid permease [Rhodococcus opacus]ANS31130.1 amino acid transporter [Rhodococcus opacus]EKT77793.1 amino acid transporter [Rhodococcus opacus M213]
MAPHQPELTEDGLSRGLNARHIRMIALGGAIGVGLFLGSGKGINFAGPALIAVYAITGFFIFIVMRALGELLMYRPVTGSFAAYAREFLGPSYGFITGWGYWLTWTIIGMAELTAAGIFVRFWLPSIPQYLTALVALVAIMALNLARVGFFGEAEFWFASIKIVTILALIIGGACALIFNLGTAGRDGSIENLWSHGGLAPQGLLAVLLAFQIVVFSYQGVELIGMTAAETSNREKVLPKAINSIPWRIGIFYVGTLIVLLSLFPWDQFSANESPFVKGFAQLGLPAAASVMNFVVLASALSSCSAGLYSNGRLLKKLASDGMAPARFRKTNKDHVPAASILASGAVMLIGVVVNAIVPEKAFSYISAVATIGGIWCWGIIVVCHLVYRSRVAAGVAAPSPFRLPFAKPLCWATLVFFAFVTVLLAFDESQRVALYAVPIWAAVLLIGYRASRFRHAVDEPQQVGWSLSKR